MSENRYYVYLLRIHADGVPIYVGKGSKIRATWRPRWRNNAQRLKEIEAEHGNLHHEIIRRGLSQSEAFALEIELIALHKRDCDGGTLVNVSTGGPGSSGVKQSAETIAKRAAGISAAQRGVPKSPEHREKVAAKNRARCAGKPAYNKGVKMSDEQRALLSSAQKGRHATEAQRAANEERRGTRLSPEQRAKISSAMKLLRQRQREARQGTVATPP